MFRKKKHEKHVKKEKHEKHEKHEKPEEETHEKKHKKSGQMLETVTMDNKASDEKINKTTLKLIKTKREYPKFIIKPNPRVSMLPTKGEVSEKGMTYPLIEPYSYASIKLDPKEHIMVYTVIEPKLSYDEERVLERIKEGLIQIIDVSLEDIRKEEELMDFMEYSIQRILIDYDIKLTDEQYIKIMYYIFRDFIGLNEIEPLLRDPYIEDIGLDGLKIPIYVVHQRYGSLRTNILYNDMNKLKDFVTKLAERCDRYISYAEPLLDGTLPDGTRVQASIAKDVTTRGPTFSIRKFRELPFTPTDMINLNTASPELLAYLWFVVENNVNILLAGGVATGKTSMLNTLTLFIPHEDKIVSIEDTRELSLPHENWIPTVTRMGFTGTGIGEINLFDLLKESFRQNPDYLIVGEIRGKEAYVMFQSMASGHPSISTMHAGSVDDVIRRLQTEPINLSASLLETLDIVIVMVHAREKGKSARRVKELVEIESIDHATGTARTSKVFFWMPSNDTFEYKGSSWVLSKISTDKGIPMNTIVREIAKRKKILEWLAKKNINAMQEIVRYIKMYHTDPDKIDELIGHGR